MVLALSRLSFKSFCIENYAKHKNMNSADVFYLFEESGLISLLDSDYEDLHGMDFGYLMHFFDEYLEATK